MAKQKKPQKQPRPQQPLIAWQDDAPESDYQSAAHFLALLDNREHIDTLLADLRVAPIVEYKAIDLLRAAQLIVPKQDDLPTREQLRQIRDGEPIAPILLVRVEALKKVIVADGFHRICAAYRTDPDVMLHCKLVG